MSRKDGSKVMKLFEELQIGSMTVKNRIALAPMGSRPGADGRFMERDIAYFTERAKGGVGLIFTGAVAASDEFETPTCHKLTSVQQVYPIAIIADQLHMYGAKFCLQLTPGLGRMSFVDPSNPPYSSSPNTCNAFPGMLCRELPTEGVKKLVKAMGRAALLAKNGGVDMVEVHAYGGYLIDQFTSARWNRRTDEYGGSFENRQRFLFEIIDEIRKTCGRNYPIAVKLTLDSMDDPERPLEEGLAIAKRLDEYGIDLLHIGRGAYSCRWRMLGSVYQPDGYDLDATSQVRGVVKNTPIMIHGKLNNPAVAIQAVESGATDMIAIGHGLIADPYWPKKVKSGQYESIVPCIGCGECQFNSYRGKPRPCAVNPLCMHENEYQLTSAQEKKRIMVIGAGPAGMKAAETAAKRGFEVSLWEKKGSMGGIMKAAVAPSFKKDVREQVNYLIRQVNALPIDVHLNHEVSLQDVVDYAPDFVVVASGADAVRIPVPGADKPHVSFAVPVLLGEQSVGQRVVVIGGGEVGCELSVHLSQVGKEVTVIEVMDDILKLADHFVANDQNLRYLVSHSSVQVRTSTKLIEILDSCVKIEHDGKTELLPCDSVVFAAGFRSNHSLYDAVRRAGFEVVDVGDNVKPGKVINATHDAYHFIRVL